GTGGVPSGGTGAADPEAAGAAAGAGARRDLAATGGDGATTVTATGIALVLLTGGVFLTVIRRRAHRRGRV
ncbi:LPXTG cell wall anchor domain-containing protein, partial [Microbacterium arborescens]